MAETLAVAAVNIRTLLNEDDPADYAVDTVTLYHLIVAKAQDLGLPLNLGLTTSAALFSLTAGSQADYPLTSAIHASVEILWVPSLGYELMRRSHGEITRMRAGIVTGMTGGGEPRFYAIYEAAGIPQVRVNCIPTTTRAVDVTFSQGIASTYTDATSVTLDELMLRVLEKEVARECLVRMLPKQREEREIGEDTIKLWSAELPGMRRRALERAHRIRSNAVFLEDQV